MGTTDNFCLRWNDFESNISASFTDIREEKEFFDVTLCCDEGNSQLQAHKIILAACSPFFRKILRRNPHQNPLIYLKGVDYPNLTAVLNFMYHGEVNVAQDELSAFLRVAEELAVKGLTDNKSNNRSISHMPRKDMKRPHDVTPANSNVEQRHSKKKMTEMPSSSSSGYMSSNVANKLEVMHEIESSTENTLAVESEGMTEGAFDEAATAADMDEEYRYEVLGDGGDYPVPEDENDDETTAMGIMEQSDGNKGYERVEVARRVSSFPLPPLPESVTNLVVREDGLYKCVVCNQKGTRKHHITRHIESKHMQHVYSCDFCHFKSNARHSLQVHVGKYHRCD